MLFAVVGWWAASYDSVLLIPCSFVASVASADDQAAAMRALQ